MYMGIAVGLYFLLNPIFLNYNLLWTFDVWVNEEVKCRIVHLVQKGNNIGYNVSEYVRLSLIFSRLKTETICKKSHWSSYFDISISILYTISPLTYPCIIDNFEDTNKVPVIRSRKLEKDRQCNGQKKNDKQRSSKH